MSRHSTDPRIEVSSLLDIRGLGKVFLGNDNSTLDVIQGLDLSILEGEFLVLLGPSGCGKSTLLNILCEQMPHESGTVSYADGLRGKRNVLDLTVVWQEDPLLPWKTVFANVELALLPRAVPAKNRKEAVMHWLDAVGLSGFEKYYPAQLSQGMRKRVALAAALAPQPKLLLMDEPFSALDSQTKLKIETVLLSLLEEVSTTVIMVTHDVYEAITLADRIALLTKRPARVQKIRENPLEKPRTPFSLVRDSDFHELARELWNELTIAP